VIFSQFEINRGNIITALTGLSGTGSRASASRVLPIAAARHCCVNDRVGAMRRGQETVIIMVCLPLGSRSVICGARPGVGHGRCRYGPRCRSKPGHGFRHKTPGVLSVSTALARPETTPAAANDLCPCCWCESAAHIRLWPLAVPVML
jgi:hypothetical protein